MSASRKYRIRHETRYQYAADVMHSHHLLHLVPRPAPFQECLDHDIQVSPENHRRVNEIDAFGNPMIRVELAQPHRELTVVSEMRIEVYPRPAVPIDTTCSWEKVRESFEYHGAWPSRDELDAARFRHESPHVRLKQSFTDYSAGCFPPGQSILQCAEELSTKLHEDIKYVSGVTNISTSPTEILETRRGVCQDFAHLMISCLRSRGLPARYVSGYLRTNAALVGDNASHAWVSVWSPPFGWMEFDPTNGCFAGTDHVAVAWGRDFGDVSPLRGVILGGAEHKLTVNVTVTELTAGAESQEPSSAARKLATSADKT